MREVLAGDLESISLASIVQFVEADGLSGRLDLGVGHLVFSEGNLVEAQCLSLEGTAAAVEALVRVRGRFVLRLGDVPAAPPLAEVVSLVLESCRVLDELERFGGVCFRPSPRLVGDIHGLVARFDGKTSLAEILAADERGVVTVLDAVVQAIEKRHLDRVASTNTVVSEVLALRGADTPAQPSRATSSRLAHVLAAPLPPAASGSPPPNPAPAPTPAAAQGADAFARLLLDARQHVRARELKEAEEKLLLALTLRPGDRIALQNYNRVLVLKERG